MMKSTTSCRIICFCFILYIPLSAMGQTHLSGQVLNAVNRTVLPGISIAIKGKVAGTITNESGKFSLTTSVPTPFTIAVTGVSFQTQERIIAADQVNLNIELQEQTILGQEVVVAASRVEESVIKSPVSVEKLDLRAIQATPSATFYDALSNLKGVDMSTQSLTFRSVNVRGFGANGNLRVVQLVDGMDNQAPGLNFSIGNIAGVSELDLESVELLPGAASALYGPNAINGLLLMTSKSPFLYQGLSAQVKAGAMNAANRSTAVTPYYDLAIRYAKSFNNKLAIKANVSYLKATDWQATDNRDQSFANGYTPATGTQQNNPGYDGINVYGDASANLYSSLYGNGQAGNGTNGTSQLLGLIESTQIPFANNQTLPQLTGQNAQQLFNALIPNLTISRTGYREQDLIDYKISNLKLSGAVHYRLNDALELIGQANWGTGTTVYTGIDRFYIKGFSLGQYKLELKGANFFVRAYTTQERSGDAYATSILGQGINEAWKGSVAGWFPQFFGSYAQSALLGYAQSYLGAVSNGQSSAAATAGAQVFVNSQQNAWLGVARGIADNGRLAPGSPAFQQAFETVSAKPIPGDEQGVGARFVDKTNLYHGEFMYNFNKLIKPSTLELLVGGNVRKYALGSNGTIFLTKEDGTEYTINEFGGYAQAAKTIAGVVKLTGSVRYDKNQNFKPQFSPRLSAVVTVSGVHNFRASFQQGFRIPTTQSQYINLNTPTARLVGGLPIFAQKYNFAGNPVYTSTSVLAFTNAIQNGTSPAQASALLQRFTNSGYDPERVETYEIGYKALIRNRLFIDAYYYYNRFLNFEGSQAVVQDNSPGGSGFPLSLLSSTTRNVYSFPVNAPIQLKNSGWAVSADYMLPQNFMVGGNISFNTLLNSSAIPYGFLTGFNTPKYRYNLSVGNRNVQQTGVGFNVVWRHQNSFVWESGFANIEATNRQQTIIPAFGTLDAQINKRLSQYRATLKLGGTNLLGNSYTQSWGNPLIGSQYYVSLLID